MDFPMELDCGWSLDFSDQLMPFNGSTFEAEWSDACEYRLFDGDVSKTDRCPAVSPPALSTDYGCGYDKPGSSLVFPLLSSPEVRYDLDAFPMEKIFTASEKIKHVAEPPISPIHDLPASPEHLFADILTYPALASGQESANITSYPFTSVSESPAGLLVIEQSVSLYGQQAVSEVRELDCAETLEEDMVLELDDTDYINDIAIDHERLASIGPDLPSVSLDDVISLLSPAIPAAIEDPSVIVLPTSASSPYAQTSPQFYLSSVKSPDAELSYVDEGYIGSPSSPQNTLPYVVISTPVSPSLQVNTAVSNSPPNSPAVSASPYLLIGDQSGATIQENGTSFTPILPSSPWNAISTSPSPASLSSSSSDAVTISKPPVERRLRKKEQNKTAAQRYREKKRGEHGTVLSEYEQLECRNTELRAKVDDMSKEIAYLKGLIEEICA